MLCSSTKRKRSNNNKTQWSFLRCGFLLVVIVPYLQMPKFINRTHSTCVFLCSNHTLTKLYSHIFANRKNTFRGKVKKQPISSSYSPMTPFNMWCFPITEAIHFDYINICLYNVHKKLKSSSYFIFMDHHNTHVYLEFMHICYINIIYLSYMYILHLSLCHTQQRRQFNRILEAVPSSMASIHWANSYTKKQCFHEQLLYYKAQS